MSEISDRVFKKPIYNKAVIESKEEENMFFRVIAKCGNFKKNAYVPISFAVKAPNLKEAVEIAKQEAHVNKELKNPIISVTEIDRDSYDYLVAVNANDPFFKRGYMPGKLKSIMSRMEIERVSPYAEFI